ncbi:threonylcarbamoyl-AMP synthase [Candidatus Woesebacteria bacterium]|nr:threonylcarbamoyl-AMP synthase [Candidatus Woesebacteria bacterium]
MKRLLLTNQNLDTVLKESVAVLKAGGLLLFPTETTYGAGVDACNPDAVAKLLAYKSRREGKPLSIAVSDIEMAQKYVVVNAQAKTLYSQFLPGPVTVVSKGLGEVAPGVESEFGTLGVRISSHPFVEALVKAFGGPITATSANGSGEKRPYSIDDVLTRLSGKQLALLDLCIDAGQLPVREPSTVIDTTLSAPITLRQGDVNLSANAENGVSITTTSELETKQLAGQLLLKHWDWLGQGPIIVALDGPLGAGKTVFTKGIADFLQLSEHITSPTYTYIEEYDFTRHQTSGTLYHLDMWKVDSADQFERLEFVDLLKPNSVVVIEWWSLIVEFAQPVLEKYPNKFIHCTLSDNTGGGGASDERQIIFVD